VKSANRWLLLVLSALAAGLILAPSGWGDLYNETDGQYGAAAKTMARGGSWLVPENDGIPRLVKPPLLYWAMAVSMKTFGVNAFAARLPGALATVAWVLLTFLFGTRMGGAWRGFLAGAILLTSLGIFTLGRIVMPEPLFSALIAGGLYCVLRAQDDAIRRQRWFVGFWICAALASFTKGPHGLLYPLLIIGGAVLLCPSARKEFRGLLSWQGALIFLAINLPWYVFIESKYPGWLGNLFFTEQLGHVTGSSAPATNYSIVPRWQFLFLHGAWFFPWSIVTLTVLLSSWKSLGRIVIRRPNFTTALVASWAVVILASVLLAGQRQDYYAMAMWPAAMLGIAALIENRSLRPAAITLSVLLAMGFLAALALPLLSPTILTGDTASVAERSTAWATLTNFDRSVWQSLRVTALWSLGGATLGAALAAGMTGRKQIFALVAASACLAFGAVGGMSVVSPYFSLAKIAPVLTSAATSETRLIYDGGLDSGSSLLFYTDLPVTWLDQNPKEDFVTRRFGIGRDLFLTSPQLAKLWKSGQPILLVTEKSKLLYWQSVTNQKMTQIAESGTQILLKN
jgi:4-amino-4-deoxy-L-arabinose transferase-like glycosyltransferase